MAESDFEALRLLRRMRVRGAGVTLELLQHRVSERTLRKHAAHGLFKRAAGKAGLHLLEIRRSDAAGIAAVTVVELRLGLVPGHAYFVDVGHDDEIAGIDVRREDRLVLAS